MSNFDFLQKYQGLQKGIMLDRIMDLGFASVAYCKGDSSSYWNHALVNKKISEEELSKIEETLSSLERTPAFYFESKKELKVLKDFLKEKGYENLFETSWMFWARGELGEGRFKSVKKVEDEESLEVFLDTFDACYQKDDPQNPYGELGDYLEVARKAWFKNSGTNKIEYFVVYKKDKPVAVSTLTNHEDIGYISNVGSLREVRGEGFGKTASLYCVKKSKENGNEVHSLATEEGTYPNEFYKRIGFETKFTAVGFIKKS